MDKIIKKYLSTGKTIKIIPTPDTQCDLHAASQRAWKYYDTQGWTQLGNGARRWNKQIIEGQNDV